MSFLDLTLRESDFEHLRSILQPELGIEAAAYVLCGGSNIGSDPWERQSRLRLTVKDIHKVPRKDCKSASGQHVTWSTASYVKLLKKAQKEKLVPGIIHTHPNGPARFSKQDDKNEKDLLQMFWNRDGDRAKLVSLLLTGNNNFRARLWPDMHGPIDANWVRVIGRRFKSHRAINSFGDSDFQSRQALAFGSELNSNLREMRIGIVGCGGTGSATAMLLARLGVGRLVLFDKDIVEVTNLNRLHGSRRADADSMQFKVNVVAKRIAELGLGVRVISVPTWVTDPCCRDTLKACDVIFGCTDDHDGRMLLNRLAYFYLIPVIDMGLSIEPHSDWRGMRDLTGRVTVLTPGAPCLLCRGIVDPNEAYEDDLQRKSPDVYEKQKREAYVRGARNLAPAVVTFTTETACLAVNELLQGMTDFRTSGGWVRQRVRRFHIPEDRYPGAPSRSGCVVCSSKLNWGRGDMEPFLDRVG